MTYAFYCCCFLASINVSATHIIAITEHLPPYQRLHDDFQVTGFTVEIVKALGEELGDDITIEVLPWARAYRRAQEEPNVLIFSMYRIPARDKLFKWVGKVDENVHYFYALRNSTHNHIKTVAQAKEKIIAVTGNAFEDRQLTSRGFKRLAKVSSPDKMVSLLFNKRVELLFGSEIAIANLASQDGYSTDDLIRLITIENWGDGLWLAFSKATADEIVHKYQQAYKRLHDNGQFNKIKADHFHFNFIKP